jgi:mono/diheme cytochrome c family protein
MQALRLLSIVLFSLIATASIAQVAPPATQDKTKQIWQLLDYLAVDYGRSVKEGQIANEAEYAEMQEFAQAAERQLAELPAVLAAPTLASDAAALRALIAQKASAASVGEQARKLAGGLIAAYPVSMAPGKLPDLQRGATLYQSQCASCHGVSGHADGPLAAKLNPPPIALADHERARERSVFALQQIITRGVAGTSMPGFVQLSDEDRWALAYFASTLSYSEADQQAGAKLWAAQPALREAVPTLATLSQHSEAALAKTVGADAARQLTAYLRSTPQLLATSNTGSIQIAKDKLRESVVALDNGNERLASQLALSAYLDGFEPVEPALAAKNQALFHDIEKTMGLYRNALSAGQVERAHDIAQQLQTQLDEAQEASGGHQRRPLDLPRCADHPAAGRPGSLAGGRRHDGIPEKSGSHRCAALRACGMDDSAHRRGADLASGDLCRGCERRQPRDDGGGFRRVCRRCTPGGGHVDAPEESCGSLADLCEGKIVVRAEQGVCSRNGKNRTLRTSGGIIRAGAVIASDRPLAGNRQARRADKGSDESRRVPGIAH